MEQAPSDILQQAIDLMGGLVTVYFTLPGRPGVSHAHGEIYGIAHSGNDGEIYLRWSADRTAIIKLAHVVSIDPTGE